MKRRRTLQRVHDRGRWRQGGRCVEASKESSSKNRERATQTNIVLNRFIRPSG